MQSLCLARPRFSIKEKTEMTLRLQGIEYTEHLTPRGVRAYVGELRDNWQHVIVEQTHWFYNKSTKEVINDLRDLNEALCASYNFLILPTFKVLVGNFNQCLKWAWRNNKILSPWWSAFDLREADPNRLPSLTKAEIPGLHDKHVLWCNNLAMLPYLDSEIIGIMVFGNTEPKPLCDFPDLQWFIQETLSNILEKEFK